MNKPLISVITASWRKEGVEQVIRDIDNQTFPNWEHILVRDNSPHISSQEIKEMCNDSRRHWVDLGVNTKFSGGYARNIGIMASFSYLRQVHKRDWSSFFICFCDDDNLFDNNHLELMVEAIKNNSQATMVGVPMRFATKTATRVKKLVVSPDNCDLGSFLYRRDLFFKYGFFHPRPDCRFRFDYDLIKKMADGEKDNLIILDKPTWTFTARK